MSPANVQYVLAHNPEVNPTIVEIAPNSYDIQTDIRKVDAREVRQKYGLPIDKPIFIYGGNMGKPQGIPFLIECMNAVKDRTDCHFVLVGNGTEYPKLDTWVKHENPKAVSVFKKLPKADYDALASACDVGLIFLDYRFTIPNYPSRLLPYLMERKPIIAATDPNCDTGTLAEANGYGFYSPSNSVSSFVEAVEKMLVSDIRQMGENGYQYYLNNYTVEHTYQAIVKHLKEYDYV
jgi:glycosyltransferase involved in cell wall biosynthesis